MRESGGKPVPAGTDISFRVEVDAAQRWDAFVLFNPGMGEPEWLRAWVPTLDALAAARRPLLLTALSRADD